MTKKSRFNPRHHLPRYSKHILEILQMPVIIYFAFLGNLSLFGGIASFYFFEKEINPNIHNLFDALWWGITTVTTVGYGDITPMTSEGRFIGMILMFTGVIFFVCFVSVLSSFFMIKIEEQQESEKPLKNNDDIKSQLDRIERKIDSLLKEKVKT